MPKKRDNTKLKKRPIVFSSKPIEGDGIVNHHSYSSLSLFSTNPFMYKVKHINGDKINSTRNISGVLGQAFHKAMEVYWGGSEDIKPKDGAEAVELGLRAGMDFIEKFPEGWIEWSKTIPTRQKTQELFAFMFSEYVKVKHITSGEKVLLCEQKIEEYVDVEYKGVKKQLPIKLKGYIDKVSMFGDKLKIVDYKTCRSFSNPEKIDGKKILQAITYYLLVYARTGIAPHSMIFEEVKYSKSRDGKQVQTYEIVYEENNLFFDFFFRFYEDVTRALSGDAVFVPNIDTFFDNEVSIIAYIHRLDMSEEQAALMKEHKVDNLTALLQQKIQSAGNMRSLMQSVEKKFVSAQSLNYENMTKEQQIATKLLEHGLLVKFHSIIEGPTVDLYQYTPSIGLKMSKIESFKKDIEQVLGTTNIRVLAPIPNSTFIGFEVPKKDRYFPALPEPTGTFDLAIGQTIMGETRTFDIREAPHMLVAGATGSGKSVFLNSLIEQIVKIPNAELHLFDPKVVELSFYESVAVEYQTDAKAINNSLEDLVIEMEERYQAMKVAGVRNISKMTGFPYKFVFIDEFGDLVLNAGVQTNVLLLAQKARAAGIHLIVATQRPSTDVIKGTIKANLPTKAVFRTAKEVDSRVILDESGAESLAGKGDMLFASDLGVERLQGFNV